MRDIKLIIWAVVANVAFLLIIGEPTEGSWWESHLAMFLLAKVVEGGVLLVSALRISKIINNK